MAGVRPQSANGPFFALGASNRPPVSTPAPLPTFPSTFGSRFDQ
jgi:hypothetical protein